MHDSAIYHGLEILRTKTNYVVYTKKKICELIKSCLLTFYSTNVTSRRTWVKFCYSSNVNAMTDPCQAEPDSSELQRKSIGFVSFYSQK